MSSDPNIKMIRLTPSAGGASDAASRKKLKKESRTKTLKIGRDAAEEGGGSTSPGTLTQLSASSNPGDPRLPPPVGVNSSLTAKGAPVQEAGKPVVKAAETPVKVVLGAAKKKGRVILAAAKSGAAVVATGAAKTRKIMRSKKVRMTISSLGKKIHKAKEIRKTATESTLEEVKKALSKAGLVKADSKAPETMLRQMYADYMTLKGRAL